MDHEEGVFFMIDKKSGKNQEVLENSLENQAKVRIVGGYACIL